MLSGRVQDRNGPWLSDRFLELGVELAHLTICGDRSDDIEAQLRFMAEREMDLIVTSGGLGPTADDKTVEVVASFCGLPLVLDERLEERIAEILKRYPPDDPVHRAVSRSYPVLREAVDRTRARLAAVADQPM